MIDGHIDLSEFARTYYKLNISAFDLNQRTVGLSYVLLKRGME